MEYLLLYLLFQYLTKPIRADRQALAIRDRLPRRIYGGTGTAIMVTGVGLRFPEYDWGARASAAAVVGGDHRGAVTYEYDVTYAADQVPLYGGEPTPFVVTWPDGEVEQHTATLDRLDITGPGTGRLTVSLGEKA